MGLTDQKRDAWIDPSGRYRYRLDRIWSDRPRIVFVGLNPSTADAHVDDPTLRRCISFATSWGYGALSVVNLFALRSPRPADLLRESDPVGPRNDVFIEEAMAGADRVWVGWGNHGRLNGRGEAFTSRLAVEVWCVGKTRHGQPRHPLYVRGDTLLERYRTTCATG